METKIEGGYVRDEMFAKEYFSFHTYRQPLGIVLTVICVLAIISGLINVIALQQYWGVFNIALGIFFFVLRGARVKKNVRIFLERDKEGNRGHIISVQNFVTENAIVVKSSLNEARTEYEMSRIEKVYRSKHYIYLLTKAQVVIVFDINGFSKGTPEELIEWMRQKGIKVNVK